METISKQTRVAFREHLVGWTLRTITDLFDAADIPRRDLPAGTFISGARRSLVEEYFAGVDWSSPKDTRKVLRAYEQILRELETNSSDWGQKALQKFVTMLRRDGFAYANGHLVPVSGIDLATIEDGSAVIGRQTLRDHLRRIEQSIDTDPAQAIGSAKELVETVAKLVLKHHHQDPDQFGTLQQLLKQALKCLNLSNEDMPESKKGSDSIRQVFSGLAQIVGGTAELRNLYGTGHGRVRAGGLEPRHARFVVGAAGTVTRFLLETLDARRAPG